MSTRPLAKSILALVQLCLLTLIVGLISLYTPGAMAKYQCLGLFSPESARALHRQQLFRHYLRSNILWPQSERPISIYLLAVYLKDPFPLEIIEKPMTGKELNAAAKAMNAAHASHGVRVQNNDVPMKIEPQRIASLEDVARPFEHFQQLLKILEQQGGMTFLQAVLEKNGYDAEVFFNMHRVSKYRLTDVFRHEWNRYSFRDMYNTLIADPYYTRALEDIKYIGQMVYDIMTSKEIREMGASYKQGLTGGAQRPSRLKMDYDLPKHLAQRLEEQLRGTNWEPYLNDLRFITIHINQEL